MLKVEKAIAFTLPNGAFVRVETTGTGKEGVEAGPDDWNALDVKLIDRTAGSNCCAASNMRI